MPSYKGHLAGGAVAFGIVLFVVTQRCTPTSGTLIEWLSCALAGSLFPDIDVKSKGQKYFYWLMLIVLIVLSIERRYEMLAAISILAIVPMLARHRGIFHKLWFVIMVPVLLCIFMSMQYPSMGIVFMFDTMFFIAGAISHLWLDVGLRRMMRW